MKTKVIEWAPFQVRRGIGEAQLLEASARLQADFLTAQPGFLGRRLVRAGAGYGDLVLWASAEDAEAAMRRAAESAHCAAFFALMDEASAAAGAGVAHYTVLAEY